MSIHRTRRARAAALLATAATVAATLAACGGSDDSDGGGGGGDAKSIDVWIEEDLPDRVAATQAIVDQFTKETGIEVKLTAVAEDQFNQILTSNAAAGDLPDVMGGIPLGQIRTLSSNELLDTDAVADVLDDLGTDTFSESALDLTADGDTALAVPSESWVQLLLYRKDLFDQAGLAAPQTYDDVLAAAKALDSGDVAGFVGANVAGDAFTEQTFEEIGLGNGCQLVDDSGDVTFDSDECVEAMDFYGQLQTDYSVTGAQDVDTTRASYFAGQAAMLIWSSFILDELAGLRNDALPTCAECADDPSYLAKNSGVVTSIQGPSGDEPATFGEITSWTIPAEASSDPAKKFVEYMMTDGYEPWIAIAPEGKIPVRSGPDAGSTEYADAWAGMDVGVDTKAPLSQFYGPEVIDALTSGTDSLSRWAIPQGQGDLLGAIQGEQPVANAVNEVANGTSAEDAVKEAADAIKSAADSL
ncbi:extracellular solute-binding protein [Nocardioides anomalus]|uniref:Extracellular solute-binding protein n=1 Tax=Nocardioides anomalus TaxID=2712223 RepID=A0A6G6WI39_9ACTN|nr:extracellular solute-binding protein [Nocardioides anomalus]QIG44882.1 extracellular solute-binding protein [Nocardioides anomalus]